MRVLIAEDEALLRDGLALLLERAGFEVVGQAAGADELVQLTGRLDPDLVITDIRMPPTYTDDGLRAALEIRERHPTVSVLVLSQHVQREYALQLLGDHSDGVGYLLKQRIADVEEFCQAARRVGLGGTVLDPEVVDLMMARAGRHPGPLQRLTPRQREVLSLIAEGRSNLGIARLLGVSEKAVVSHTSHIYDQLCLSDSDGDHRRVLAVVHWLADQAASSPAAVAAPASRRARSVTTR
jgi:DNA-binding NarL/FixJ family response regulator